MRGELELKDNAIANLQNQLSGVVLQLKESDDAIAKLKTELEVREVKQLNLFPPEPTPTPTPEPNTDNPVIESSPVTVTGISELVTVGTPGLLDYINLVDPKSGVTKDGFDNAMTRHLGAIKNGKTPPQGEKSIPFLEAKYSFKCLGKNGKYHQFSIPNP